ncbi:MAG: universal stress protein [Candidatus Rokubacteria bacterium]|nr:universal stress protein [Candidatus Rokubacteria bacterium]
MYSRVLIPLDGSEVAEAALPLIERIAAPLGLEVVLVRVVLPHSRDLIGVPAAIAEDERVARLREAKRYLEGVAATLGERGVRAIVQVRVGAPPAEIVAAAIETGADLIAMTTHGRSGLGRLLFGSVAESVLRGAPIPVIVMRPAGAVARAATEGARA